MLAWPHSGFGAYLGPRLEEREGLLRVARYCARAPVADSRLRYDAERAEVELVADPREGPYAGVHRMPALEFVRARGAVGGSRAGALRGAGALRRGVRDAAAGVVAAARHRAGGRDP